MYHISVSGTRKGMSVEQRVAFKDLIRTTLWSSFDHPVHLHHGDCVGVDREVHLYFVSIRKHFGFDITTHAHPGFDRYGKSPYRAYCDADIVHDVKPYRTRNQIMVDGADVEIILPRTEHEVTRGSGSWQSYRMARLRKVSYPDLRLFLITPRGVGMEIGINGLS